MPIILITMYGYMNYALKEAEQDLWDNDFDEKQIENIKSIIKGCMNYAVDIMTMEEARKYYNKGGV